MQFSEFWQRTIFSLGGQDISLGQICMVLGALIVLVVLSYLIQSRWLPRFFAYEKTTDKDQRKIRRISRILLVLLATLLVVKVWGLDRALSAVEDSFLHHFKVSTIIEALLIYFFARMVDEMLSGLLTHRYQQRREQQIREGNVYAYGSGRAQIRVGHIVQPIVYLVAAMFILQELGLAEAGFDIPWAKLKENGLKPRLSYVQILAAITILLVTRLLLWVLTEIILYPYYKQREINVGSQYAINRLLTYFVLVIAILFTLQYIGLDLTVLLGGAAALLVGIGLGLQQTFNDLICGIILLFERTVEINDVVEVNDLVGTVKKIGIRTSLVETVDQVSVIVPNSKLVGDNVVNWSHYDAKARFHLSIGVAYGSDTQLVKQILLEVAGQHEGITRRPMPTVRFTNFGDSALDFELLFWSRKLTIIEDIKSDLRFAIDARFREAGISIPFPQRDVWLRKGE